MKFEHELHPEFFTAAERRDMHIWFQASDPGMRLWTVTDLLRDAGISDEAIMLEYLNECLRIATSNRGVAGAYILVCEFYWHVVNLVKKLHAASGAIPLSRLPEAPPDESGQPDP